MYLSDDAIEASVATLRALLAPGSTLAFTYFTRERLARPSIATRALGRLVRRQGEPWRFGWEPSELPAWLASRGFRLERDDDAGVARARVLPEGYARRLRGDGRRIAIATRA